MTIPPPWASDVRRTKVRARQPDTVEQLRGSYRELRLRYLKLLRDNVNLRSVLAQRQKQKPEKPVREYERGTLFEDEGYDEDLADRMDRLRNGETW
jgi:hypothetical protein